MDADSEVVSSVARKQSSSAFIVKPLGIHVRQTFKIRDSKTGEMRDYHSLDEVPPGHRGRMRRTVEAARASQGNRLISARDASGEGKTCHSISEMPPELHAVCEKAMGDRPDQD